VEGGSDLCNGPHRPIMEHYPTIGQLGYQGLRSLNHSGRLAQHFKNGATEHYAMRLCINRQPISYQSIS